jgi:hypothetical protein
MDHISEIAQLIGAVALLLNGVISALGYFSSLRNGKILVDVKAQTDGINSKLVTVTGEAEHAKGMLQGALEQRGKDA